MNPKSARLFCQTGAMAGTSIDITKDIVIGRQPSCDLVVYPHTVSGKHARIFFNIAEGVYYIEDLNSSNGTWVDRVQVDKPMRLDPLSVITLANDIDFIFQFLDTAPARHSAASTPKKASQPARESTVFQDSFSPPPSFQSSASSSQKQDQKNTMYQSAFAPPPDLDPPADPSKEKTVYNKSFPEPPPSIQKPPPAPPKKPVQILQLAVTTNGKEERFILRPGAMTIGRSSSCDITISDPFISSTHASLQLSKSAFILQDLGSSNKTYIDGKAINKPVKLQPGMTIRFGPNTTAIIIKEQAPQE